MAPSSLQEVDGNCRNLPANRESMASQGSSLCVLGGVVACHGTHNSFATTKVLRYSCEPSEPSNNHNRTSIDIFKSNCAG